MESVIRNNISNVSDVNNWVEAFRFVMESEWKEGISTQTGDKQVWW